MAPDEQIEPDEIARHLPHLRKSYIAKTGESFKHFFCPFLHKDEASALCMGHVIPQCLPNCCRSRVVQRADVDNFYGRIAEAEFSTLVEVRGKGIEQVMLDADLSKKVKPRIVLDGEDIKYYPYKGHRKPSHSRLMYENADGETVLDLVLAKSPEELAAADPKRLGFLINQDCRISALVTLIKAAYLTLFRLHGYRWALSVAGAEVGRDSLGKFFVENHKRDVAETREAAKSFFKPFVNMVRPIHKITGDPPMRGTIEDNRSCVCFGSSGRPFGLVVFVRVDEVMHAVLMPVFDHPDSIEAYLNFTDVKNDSNETLRMTGAWFDAQNEHWLVHPNSVEAHWPKKGDTFAL